MATQIQDPLFDPLVGAVEEYYKDDPIAKNTAKKSISAAFTTNPTQLEINRKQFETLLQVRPFSKDKPTDYTTYASCLRKFPLQSNCVSSRQVAAELNIDVKGKNDREICQLVNKEQQRRCVADTNKCPTGTEPDWPKNPTCCRLKNLSTLLEVEDTTKFIDETTLAPAEKQKFIAANEKDKQKLTEKDEVLGSLSQEDQNFIEIVGNVMQKYITNYFKTQIRETPDTEPTKDSANWSFWNTWKSIREVFVRYAKKSFDIILYIVKHPMMAWTIARFALLLKRRFCRYLSARLGYGGGGEVYVDKKLYVQHIVKDVIPELGWQVKPLLYSVGSDFINAYFTPAWGAAMQLFGDIGTQLTGISLINTFAASVGNFIPSLGVLMSAVISELHETIRMTMMTFITAQVLKNTGEDFLLLFTDTCLQPLPVKMLLADDWAGKPADITSDFLPESLGGGGYTVKGGEYVPASANASLAQLAGMAIQQKEAKKQ